MTPISASSDVLLYILESNLAFTFCEEIKLWEQLIASS